MNKVCTFVDADHSYWLDGKRMVSTTTAIGMFEPKYNEPYWSSYKAVERVLGESRFEHLKSNLKSRRNIPINVLLKSAFRYYNMDLDEYHWARNEILAEWSSERNRASTEGSAFHLIMEKRDLKNGWGINPFTGEKFEVIKWEKEYDNESYPGGIAAMPDGYYPEALLFNEEYWIAGQADRLFIKTIDGIRYFWMDDYKTNKKRPDPDEKVWDKLLWPLDHIGDIKFNKYALQSSVYSWMLEEEGYVRADSCITHVVDYDKDQMEKIDVPYLKEDVKNMLNVLKEMKK